MSMGSKINRSMMTATFLSVFAVFALVAHSQRPGQRGGMRTVDDPFIGIRTSEGKQDGLFAIESTGVSTAPVRVAAEAFLAGLTPSQRERTVFPVDDSEWRKWDNRHRPVRQGVGFDEMTDEQRKLAFELFRQSLSAKGLKKTRDIMKLNGTLAELANNFDEYGEWLYWVTVMGTPSPTQPWGWQLDGHHVVINYFVLGDQVVMSPVFMGSEPVEAKQGKFQGTIVMQDEQDKGLALMTMLDERQRSKAILMNRKDGNNNLTEAYKDNVVLDYAGIKASEFTKNSRKPCWI
ncbi:putative secreted protein [Rhodopirellula sallentina SM41]|uniref:Putative secreted protein n=1 Tax=Rhodopirellula sallentina SM41 TaxID=1263870 RepID=M5U4K5_9BACT|nr:putative secreted protein [Rhodopirellula sallentina SM41]